MLSFRVTTRQKFFITIRFCFSSISHLYGFQTQSFLGLKLATFASATLLMDSCNQLTFVFPRAGAVSQTRAVDKSNPKVSSPSPAPQTHPKPIPLRDPQTCYSFGSSVCRLPG